LAIKIPHATQRAGLAVTPAAGAHAKHVIIAAVDRAGLVRATFKAWLSASLTPPFLSGCKIEFVRAFFLSW